MGLIIQVARSLSVEHCLNLGFSVINLNFKLVLILKQQIVPDCNFGKHI
jgi:hypothetical protein